MRQAHSIGDKFFRAVCLSFSVLLLLISLICNVAIMWTEAHIEELHRSINDASRENQLLRVQSENRISLSELEKLATEKLNMHRPGSEQLIFIDAG